MSYRLSKNPAQSGEPLFVKIPSGFKSQGKWYSKGDYYDWEALGVEWELVCRLYGQGYLHHNPELKKNMKKKIGDGLDELDIDQLHALRDSLNAKVKAKATTQSEYKKKAVAFSKIPSKQRGKIRSWRRTYGDIETG